MRRAMPVMVPPVPAETNDHGKLIPGIGKNFFRGKMICAPGLAGIPVLIEIMCRGISCCNFLASEIWLSGLSQAASVGVR